MELLEGLEAVDLALHHLASGTLIIADLHIGVEEALNRQGLMVPRFQLDDLLAVLKKLLARVRPRHVLVNGDVKHEFGTVSEQEWRNTLRVLDFLRKAAPVTLIKGNHDTILGPIARKRDVKVKDALVLGDTFIVHGHKKVAIPKGVRSMVIGHEHPAVTLAEGARTERFKCYLRGAYGKVRLLVQPSFNQTTTGYDLLQQDVLSPYLKQDLSGFDVFIAEAGKVLAFGTLGSLKTQHL